MLQTVNHVEDTLGVYGNIGDETLHGRSDDIYGRLRGRPDRPAGA